MCATGTIISLIIEEDTSSFYGEAFSCLGHRTSWTSLHGNSRGPSLVRTMLSLVRHSVTQNDEIKNIV